MKDDNGFIILHRKILKWEWWDDRNVRDLFIYLLLKANWEDTKYMGKTVKRGQAVIGRYKLAKQAGLTVQQTRTALNKLKSTSEITIKPTNKYSVVTINRYDEYQAINQQINKRITINQPSNNHQITTSKQYNNITSKQYNNKSTKIKKKKYGTLSSINEESIFQEISQSYSVPVSFVENKYEDLENYCESTGKKYKDYLATLRGWVKRDAEKIKKEQYDATRKNKRHIRQVAQV